MPAIRKDIREVEPADLRGFDAVVHLAALSNDPLGCLDESCTYEINHLGSVSLARAAKAAGVPRFLFASSCSLYGAAGDDMLDETAKFNPITAYGASKVLVEQDVAKLADDSFSPTYYAQCDRVRCVASTPRRHRREQPRGSRLHDGSRC